MKELILVPVAWLLALVIWVLGFRLTKVLLVPPFIALLMLLGLTVGLLGVCFECWNRNCWPWQTL